MADISTYIEKLQSAVYGEEVRGAIIDALNAINNDKGGITTYTAVDTSNNIKVTANGVTPKVGDIIAVRMTNPGTNGILPGATLTFNSDTKPIRCINGEWRVKPIEQYATVFFAYRYYCWTLMSFDGGMTNEQIGFPSGGVITPKDGESLYIGQATSNVTISRPADSNTKITANVIFGKGTASKVIFAPDYLLSGGNTVSLSSYSASDYIVVSIINGAPSIGKSI